VNLGIGRIIVEIDAQEVVKAIMSSSYDGSATSLLISEIKSLVDSNFLYFECVHADRICNRAAHELAKLGYACNEGDEVITAYVANDVTVIVANDLLANE
jgi:hypothetical protein